LYSSPSIIRVIKSRRIRWEGYVARMWRRGMRIGHWFGSQKERDHWEDQDIGDNIKTDLREVGWDGVDWIDVAQYRDQCMALVNTGSI
jgi:hypothetical protein